MECLHLCVFNCCLHFISCVFFPLFRLIDRRTGGLQRIPQPDACQQNPQFSDGAKTWVIKLVRRTNSGKIFCQMDITMGDTIYALIEWVDCVCIGRWPYTSFSSGCLPPTLFSRGLTSLTQKVPDGVVWSMGDLESACTAWFAPMLGGNISARAGWHQRHA